MRTTIIRTFNGSKVTAKTVNVTEETFAKQEFTFPVSVGDDMNKVLKMTKKAYETDELKILSIVSVEPFEDVYEISIEDFLKYAHKVTPEETAEKQHKSKN